jgi:methionyl-tRNA formyltransferase
MSSHPLADRAEHKGALLDGLLARGVGVTILYAGTRVRDYAHELRRRSLSDVRRIATRRSSPDPRPDAKRPEGRGLRAAARELGIDVRSFPTLGDPQALRFVSELNADVTLNLSALYVPPAFLEIAGRRVIGAHYAELPRLRGGDTVRWSILLDVPLAVSFQVLGDAYDMGDIVGRQAVDVARGYDVTAVRRACQRASVAGYLAVVDRFASGTLVREPQVRRDGSTFFRMGTFLRARVDALLRSGRYSHYAAPS